MPALDDIAIECKIGLMQTIANPIPTYLLNRKFARYVNKMKIEQ